MKLVYGWKTKTYDVSIFKAYEEDSKEKMTYKFNVADEENQNRLNSLNTLDYEFIFHEYFEQWYWKMVMINLHE